MTLTCGALLYLSAVALAQVGSIAPSQPKAGARIVLRYDAANERAALDAEDEVFATMQVVATSGSTNRSVLLQRTDGGRLEAEAMLPQDAVYFHITFASRWRVDARAGVRSMVYSGEGVPVRGARCHVALAARDRCLEVLAEERQAYPESFAPLRYKWAYNRLFRRGQWDSGDLQRDLSQVGAARTPSALLARVYLNMMGGDEQSAREDLLALLKQAPGTWATSTAVRDYGYFARSGVGEAAGHRKVESAVCAAMLANPDSSLVRDHLYDNWMKFDFDAVRNFTSVWSAKEKSNPLPHAILAATSLARSSNLDEGRDAATLAMNGFLKGDGRIASLDTQSLGDYYLRWSTIVAAKIARARGDFASAIAYSKAFVAYAEDGIFGHECEAQTWEELHQPSRATDCWLDALESGSARAKGALRRMWRGPGGDSEFDAHLAALLQGRRSVGERPAAPRFACEDLAGGKLDSQALRGRVLVLNFWGLGCMPCKKEIPALSDLAKAYTDKSVTFVAFASDGADALTSYVSSHPFDYRLVADAGDVFDAFGVSSLPLHVVIDGEGRVVARLPGAGPGQPARIASLIDLALAEL